MGLVFVGLARAEGSEATELLLPFDRERHRRITAQAAIDWVRRTLLGVPLELPRIGRMSRPPANSEEANATAGASGAAAGGGARSEPQASEVSKDGRRK